jgi:hypothetical protein
MKSRWIIIYYLALMMTGCGKIPMIGKIIDTDTLPERVSKAELVIIGKMVSFNMRAVMVEQLLIRDGQRIQHYTYYDVAKLHDIEVLKGAYVGQHLFIKFLSFDQTQPDQQDIDCKAFSPYNLWESGIWLIYIDEDQEPAFTVARGDFVPLSRLEEVKEIIETNR